MVFDLHTIRASHLMSKPCKIVGVTFSQIFHNIIFSTKEDPKTSMCKTFNRNKHTSAIL